MSYRDFKFVQLKSAFCIFYLIIYHLSEREHEHGEKTETLENIHTNLKWKNGRAWSLVYLSIIACIAY